MEQHDAINVFEDKQVRTLWDSEQEKWFFSIIDVIAALTGSDRPRKYWNDLKSKLAKEGSQLSDKIGQLKLKSADGKSYSTYLTDTEQLFRLIPSIGFNCSGPPRIRQASFGSRSGSCGSRAC